ncbi:MAG TPA: hypothetical protein VJZ71_10885 [Phycisphaerae bacterium]|nr:hypothetical protein [Phycisphaerae bacterium]
MSSSNSLIDSSSIFVADASVVININATKHGLDILRAMPNSLIVTENAIAELARGNYRGHTDADEVGKFIEIGAIRSARLVEGAIGVYTSLVEGSALRTLDDGEAATIAHAHAISGIALIDERKAQRICNREFPSLRVASTIDILIDDTIRVALGAQGQIASIVNALRFARMRIPPQLVSRVVDLIGAEVAETCHSLPRASRKTRIDNAAGQ